MASVSKGDAAGLGSKECSRHGRKRLRYEKKWVKKKESWHGRKRLRYEKQWVKKKRKLAKDQGESYIT